MINCDTMDIVSLKSTEKVESTKNELNTTRGNFPFRCRNCGKKGHMAKDCKSLQMNIRILPEMVTGVVRRDIKKLNSLQRC